MKLFMKRTNMKFGRKHFAFTMAEILISLTIIGIIAAIIIPTIHANIEKKTWETKKKVLYSRFAQALPLMSNLDRYGIGATQEETNEKAAMAFVMGGLNKVLKINNICDKNELEKCGIAPKIQTYAGDIIDFPQNIAEFNPIFTNSLGGYINPQYTMNTNVAALETSNGESIAVFYNPTCKPNNNIIDLVVTNFRVMYVQPFMCANFVYDLNGLKKPNIVGKDIWFITALYPTDTVVVSPMLSGVNLPAAANSNVAKQICKTNDIKSRLPNPDEFYSIFYNARLIGGLPLGKNLVDCMFMSNGERMCFYLGMHVFDKSNSSIGETCCVKK